MTSDAAQQVLNNLRLVMQPVQDSKHITAAYIKCQAPYQVYRQAWIDVDVVRPRQVMVLAVLTTITNLTFPTTYHVTSERCCARLLKLAYDL